MRNLKKITQFHSLKVALTSSLPIPSCGIFGYSYSPTKTLGVFTKLQALRLQDALASIQHVGPEGVDHAMVMPEDVVDVLLRYGWLCGD